MLQHARPASRQDWPFLPQSSEPEDKQAYKRAKKGSSEGGKEGKERKEHSNLLFRGIVWLLGASVQVCNGTPSNILTS